MPQRPSTEGRGVQVWSTPTTRPFSLKATSTGKGELMACSS